MKRSFYLQDDSSNKFWEIEVEGTSCTTRYGKVGVTGRTTEKSFATDKAAKSFA